jgi:Na+/H+ antiporter NhaD/arsenite permease-like protein
MDATVAAIIFFITYGLIATERLDKTIAALLGGLAMILVPVAAANGEIGLGIIDQHSAFEAIDFNVIFLLAGMMVLAGILRQTGFFNAVAIRSVKIADGQPIRLLLVLSLVAALASALLDNVTTVVLLAPVTLYIASSLRVSPLPFLFSEILASNIGGAATLIGDPPNILIASAFGLDFVEFLSVMAPVAIVVFIAFVVTVMILFRGDLEVHAEVRDAVLALDEREVITNPGLLKLSLAVIAATIFGFLIHGALGLEPATVALAGATILMLLAHQEPELVFKEVEWPTLFFFVGLFMLVEGIVHVGLISSLADTLLSATGGDATVATLGLLWLSGIASAIVDNIPYTATMIPLVEQLGQSGLPKEPLVWSLALGADLGGNATIVGASANVVVANVAARAGHPISFGHFLRYGSIIVVESLLISSVYLWLRFLA